MCYLKLGQTQFNLVYLVLDYRDYTTNICFILKDYTTQKARQVKSPNVCWDSVYVLFIFWTLIGFSVL